MKTTSHHVGLLMLVAIQAGCSAEYDMPDNIKPSLTGHFLTATESSISVSASAFSKNFKVGSYETAWSFNQPAAWLTIEPMEGHSSADVSLTGEENLSADEGRTSIFYLNSVDPEWDYQRVMTVSQAKAEAWLIPERTTLEFGGSGGVEKLTINSNCVWTAESHESWIGVAVDAATNTLSVSVAANPFDDYRSGSVSLLYDEDKSATVTVTQSPAAITSSVYSLEYEAMASKYTISIESDAEWTAAVSDNWIQMTPSGGKAGKTEVDVEVSSNMSAAVRNGFICVKTGDAERFQISVIQKGVFLEVDKEALVFESAAESRLLKVNANSAWEVLSAPVWTELSKTSGFGSEEVTVTSADNNSMASREGAITIGIPGTNIKKKVSVAQKGKTFETSSKLIEFTDRGGSRNFTLTTDADWKSRKTDDWFSATPTSGHGNSNIEVACEENCTTDERTGEIVYDYAGESQTVAVHQLAKYLTVSNEALTFGSRGGSHTIDISTNYDWSAAIEHDENWLHLSATSGSGSGSITITADDNASVSTRSTAVVITPKGAQAIRLLVAQNPRYMRVSHQSIEFFSKGGKSDEIAVETDGKYEMSTDAEWLEISTPVNDKFTVTASENKADRMREGIITITMTDLTEGSYKMNLKVTQATEGGTLIKEGYPDTDTDWDSWSNGRLSITITRYSADKDWNKHGGVISINITGYTTDHDWNRKDPANGNAAIFNYGEDADWDPTVGTSGDPSKSEYGADKDWSGTGETE